MRILSVFRRVMECTRYSRPELASDDPPSGCGNTGQIYRLPYLLAMPQNPNSSPFAPWPRQGRPRPSVMFSVQFEDGRTGYFTAEGHGGPDQDFLAKGMAQERQRTRELPDGVIRTVKRVR